MRSWRGKAAKLRSLFRGPLGTVGVVPAALSVPRVRCRGGKAKCAVTSVQPSVEMSSVGTSRRLRRALDDRPGERPVHQWRSPVGLRPVDH
jgi:hypothetical protein